MSRAVLLRKQHDKENNEDHNRKHEKHNRHLRLEFRPCNIRPTGVFDAALRTARCVRYQVVAALATSGKSHSHTSGSWRGHREYTRAESSERQFIRPPPCEQSEATAATRPDRHGRSVVGDGVLSEVGITA